MNPMILINPCYSIRGNFSMISTTIPIPQISKRVLELFSPLASLPYILINQLELGFQGQLASFKLIKRQIENQSDLFKWGRPARNLAWQADFNFPLRLSNLDHQICNDNTMVSHPASGLGVLVEEQFTTGARKYRAGFVRTLSNAISIEYNFVNGISKLDRCTASYGLNLAASFDWNRSFSLPRLDVQGKHAECKNFINEQINWVTTSALVGERSEVTAAR